MELTPEQIKEFEAITDYNEKLKWWQERFDYDLTPRSPNMNIVPHSIEETKLLIDWYEEGYAAGNDIGRLLIKVSSIHKYLDSQLFGKNHKQKKDFLTAELTQQQSYLGNANSSFEGVFEAGRVYDINEKSSLKTLLDYFLNNDKNSYNTTIIDFFNALCSSRVLQLTSKYLEKYTSKTKEDDTHIEVIHFEHFSHRVALLQELGVIDHLRAKYNIREVDNKKMIPILAAIMGIEDKRVIEALRKIVSSIGTNDKNNPTKSEKSKLFIRGVLAKLDLSIN